MIYKRIANNIKDDIMNGIYKENEKLPSELKLAEKYETTKMTVRKALSLLVNNGFLYAVSKVGYYVSSEQDIRSFNNINAGSLRFLNRGAKIETKVLDFKIVEARDFLAAKFNIKANDLVYAIVRVRLVNDMPYTIENIYMPKYLFEDFNISIAENSIYSYIKSKGYEASSNRKNISASIIPPQFFYLHDSLVDKPALQIENTGLLKTGVTFEYSISYQVNQEISVVTHWDELLY